MTPMPHPPYSPDLTLSHLFCLFLCFFPWMKNILKGTRFADVEDVKKMTEALKGIKINELKTVLSSGKNISIVVLHQMENILKVTEV